MTSALTTEFSKRTGFFQLKVWVVVAILFVLFVLTLLLMLFCLMSKRKARKATYTLPVSQIPMISSEFKEIKMDQNSTNVYIPPNDGFIVLHEKFNDLDSTTLITNPNFVRMKNGDNDSQSGSFNPIEKDVDGSHLWEKGIMQADTVRPILSPSPLSGSPEFSHLGWGHWFTLRDLDIATNKFSKENIIGEGGYGVVYYGHLVNGTPVAVKKLLNNMGQAETEFRVEVEAISHVRHKNLVRILGYCIEGTHRLLVYEYVNNGNLEQWLHGAMRQYGYLTWEARIKILLETAKGLAYLHEAIEPKVVHRDIKSSNILIGHDFSAKISDFGLAKLLDAGKSHIKTRVMGTFGYVAPEYANSGLLNEKSDVYSFGVVLLETITGRDPVDYSRTAHEVNLVEWLKLMVGNKRSEEVVDPTIESRPSTSALKRVLLTALRCVDPDFDKRPRMSQVVLMLESEEYPISREDRRRRKSQTKITGEESQKEYSDTDKIDNPVWKTESRRKNISR